MTNVPPWVKAYNAGKLGDIGRSYRPLTEIEMELARVKKENATLKLECEILKKQPRTLPESRCPVRGDEIDAAKLPNCAAQLPAQGFSQRLLWMAGSSAL